MRPVNVIGFVEAMTDRYSPRSMKFVRTALRSFFRFLRFEGLCGEQLDLAIPAVAHWRLSSLPRSLSERQRKQVLASFDTFRPMRVQGSRNRDLSLDPWSATGRTRRAAS